MSDIVSDLLTLSRLENQEPDPNKIRELPMAAILRSTVADLTTALPDFSHRIELDADQLLQLHGSEVEIKSLCNNLCQNAVHHTPASTKIQVRWMPLDDGAQLVVEDNGPGIEANHLNRITERFYRVDNEHSNESGGTGLGLSIVKHIVNRHRGSMEVQSTPGEGTRFMVRFPAEVIIREKEVAAS